MSINENIRYLHAENKTSNFFKKIIAHVTFVNMSAINHLFHSRRTWQNQNKYLFDILNSKLDTSKLISCGHIYKCKVRIYFLTKIRSFMLIFMIMKYSYLLPQSHCGSGKQNQAHHHEIVGHISVKYLFFPVLKYNMTPWTVVNPKWSNLAILR